VADNDRSLRSAGRIDRRPSHPRLPTRKERGVSAFLPAGYRRIAAIRESHVCPESKRGKILELMGRAKGATLAEIMKATDWQAHGVRGFLSTAAKKHALEIESTKNEVGQRVYKIGK
jgi:predicted transcriptional regulator